MNIDCSLKCHHVFWGRKEAEYLGVIVGNGTLRATPDKISVFTNHATLTHLFKQPRDKPTDRQVHWVKRLIPFAHCMSILYRKGSVSEADVVSRRLDFFHPDDDHVRMPMEMFALWLDGKVLGLC